MTSSMRSRAAPMRSRQRRSARWPGRRGRRGGRRRRRCPPARAGWRRARRGPRRSRAWSARRRSRRRGPSVGFDAAAHACRRRAAVIEHVAGGDVGRAAHDAPSAARVMLHPRASTLTGSSARTRASRPSRWRSSAAEQLRRPGRASRSAAASSRRVGLDARAGRRGPQTVGRACRAARRRARRRRGCAGRCGGPARRAPARPRSRSLGGAAPATAA